MVAAFFYGCNIKLGRILKPTYSIAIASHPNSYSARHPKLVLAPSLLEFTKKPIFASEINR